MPLPPDIITPELCITPFMEKHLSEMYVSWLNDYKLMRYSEQRHRRHTLNSCRAYKDSFQGTPNFFWAIEEKQEHRHIGNITADVDPQNLLADVGILIGERSAQGKGYGSQAFQAVCQWLLNEGGMRKVTAGTLAGNAPMLRIMQHAGMCEDGCRVRHYLWEETECDIIHMALFRS